MSVGVGQRGALGADLQSEMAKLAFESGQAAGDFEEVLIIGKLAEHHRDELLPAGEAAGMPLGLVLANGGLELKAGAP